jgi:hypothetical protein
VRARLSRARERGQPLFPWEDVSPEEWRRSLTAIQGVVMDVLRRESGEGPERTTAGGPAVSAGHAPLPPVALPSPAGSRALGVAAFTSGTGPLLGRWIELEVVAAEPDVSRTLLLHLAHGRLRASRLEAAFAGVIDRLAAAGVEPTVVKGFHSAYEVFPEPGTRPASDLDLVVEPPDLAPAERALRDAGFTPRQVLARPYTCEWTPAGESALPRSLALTHAYNPWSVDLHASFDRDFGGVSTVSLVRSVREATRTWRVAGRDVRILREPYLTAYLALHVSQELKNLTLLRLVELAWVIRRGLRSGDLTWGALERMLERERAAAYVYPGLELAERLAPGTVPAEVRARIAREAPARVRAVVDRLEPASAQRLESVSLEESFMWAVGPAGHARRLGRMLWPSWAGSPADVLRVQAARARQLLARRVSLGRSGRGGGAA